MPVSQLTADERYSITDLKMAGYKKYLGWGIGFQPVVRPQA